jgi:IPTL-CTERM motif
MPDPEDPPPPQGQRPTTKRTIKTTTTANPDGTTTTTTETVIETAGLVSSGSATACALVFGTSGQFIVSIDNVRVFVHGTATQLTEFSYVKDPTLVRRFFPGGTIGGVPPPFTQAFRSQPGSPSLAGLRTDLVLQITVKPGTTTDQLVSELRGLIVGTAGITAQGTLINIEIVQYTNVTVAATPFNVPTLSQWGMITMMLLFLVAGMIFLLRNRSLVMR